MKFFELLFFGFFLVCKAAPARECDNYNAVTLPLSKVGEKYYYIETNMKANWYAAMTFCNLHKMHLASILNEEENAQLAQHFKDSGSGDDRLWTSGSDLAGEGKWFWTSVGTRMVYNRWGPRQPDNDINQEHCLDVRMVNGELLWNDNKCFAELNLICEA